MSISNGVRPCLMVRFRPWGRRFQVRNPTPLKNRRRAGLVHAKSVEANALQPAWRGSLERGCQLRCRPRHLIAIQNYEVCPKIALVLIQNGTQL
ncbi:hypothetical protein AVEN_153652-1 [Araneus ventricosus]|uniref:Uncharacterized protein n=1 Tax=Araneus ventricosus TaxID=182803 RepID=A0A4Y2BR11_ARAVE|nr:hypothetical protein AVEN_153652-1 [Araneus ventricosus]